MMVLSKWLATLKPQILTQIQQLYNDWKGGGDGLCRKIALEIIDVIDCHKPDKVRAEFYHQNLDHVYVVVFSEQMGQVCTIDIPYHLYEWQDADYRWFKRDGVKFDLDDIKILELDPFNFFG